MLWDFWIPNQRNATASGKGIQYVSPSIYRTLLLGSKSCVKKKKKKKVGLFLLFLSTYDTINSHIKMQSVYTGKLFLDQRLIKLINNELLCTSKESMETHKSNVLFTHK